MWFNKSGRDADVEYGLDPVVAEILARPARNEGAVLDVVRKSRGDEGCETAAAVMARAAEAVVDAFGGRLPVEVAKAMRAAVGFPEPVRKAKSAPAPVEKPKPRSSDEITAEWQALAKGLERENDKQALGDLERAAQRIRKADGSLTREQAFAVALERNPDLYARHLRHVQRTQGLDDRPATLRKAAEAESRIDAAARRLRAADPSLTEAQAVVKALEANPSLYDDYLRGGNE